MDRFLKDVRKKFFIPRDFFSKAQIEKVSGIYFPYWLYGGSFDVDYKRRNKSPDLAGRGVEYTETSIYEMERSGGSAGRTGP